jgi:hypothetical protein
MHHDATQADWNSRTAADYLDRREIWWQSWPEAQMDHGTICISCHTTVPYVMVRHTLSRELHETEMPAPETILMNSVEKRVSHWSEMSTFYSDGADGPGMTASSHATEAVLNAVILASYDIQHGQLRLITRTALDEAWSLQESSGEDAGAWKWQNFHLAPWESVESGYQGAALFMLEVENMPGAYTNDPQACHRLERLQNYLQRHYTTQPLVNQLYILWLTSKVPGMLTDAKRNKLVDTIRHYQHADGGWSLSSLDPKSRLEDNTWERIKLEFADITKPAPSDGYATALVVIAMKESGMANKDRTIQRGVEWLKRHQTSDGSWSASSLNEPRDQRSDIGRFMSDAATAYAVLALENDSQHTAN